DVAGIANLEINSCAAGPLGDVVAADGGYHYCGSTVVLHADAGRLSGTGIGDTGIADEIARNLSLPGTSTKSFINVDSAALHVTYQRTTGAAVVGDVEIHRLRAARVAARNGNASSQR